MRASRSINQPFGVLATSRIGVRNRFMYDYACEDEYFERGMTLLESKTLPLPIPKDFRHAVLPDSEVWPSHWNDVRFNFKPQKRDRRVFIHDNYMNAYDFIHDVSHSFGYVDEDLDYELPDPIAAMHFKLKRSQVTSFLGIFVALAVCIGYPMLGLKVPQKDNPFYYRKKYATVTTINQMQKFALMEHGTDLPKGMGDQSSIITKSGFFQTNGGLRYDLDNYDDLIC